MLKKIIIGFICLIFLIIVGLGIYIYMLDWNQHKKLVEERFSQITGMRAVIDGDLSVELIPSPKFTANQVKFFSKTGAREPLVQVNSISANVELMAMLHQKFILSSMTLTGANINYTVNEQGESNWKNTGASNKQPSGNIEVSFNDVRLSSCVFNYKDLQNDKHFEISNISGYVSAPSLKGPYKLNVQFIHNESEIKIGGSVVNNNGLMLDIIAENAATSSKLMMKGTLNNGAKGNLSLGTSHLAALSSVIFGSEALPQHYNDSFYVSFQYERDSDAIKLDNFNIAYSNQTKGNGTALLDLSKEKRHFVSNLDMAALNLDLIENICVDVVSALNKDQSSILPYLSGNSANINIKADHGLYRNAEIQNINLALGLENNILSVHKFNVDFPGNTTVKLAGKTDFNDVFTYSFENSLKTDDLRIFASLFGIDLAGLASDENKKSIFKKADASFSLSGNLQNLKLNLTNVLIDAVELRGNMGFIFDKDKTFVIADLNSSQIIFDKYIEPLPKDMASASLEEKIVHQFNLIPWKQNLGIDAHILIPSAVYNEVPLQKISLEAKLFDDKLNVKNLSIENIADAALHMQLDAKNIYTSPYFNELSYDVKTNNFPAFASALGIALGDQKLFQRKLFASQGALNGSIKDFNLSSVQKFGDAEFAYTGTVTREKEQTAIKGDLELKANNFVNLITALNFDYSPDIPITSFSLSGKISGTKNNFALDDLTAYLGANGIRGSLHLNNTAEKPILTAKLDFDKFDADRYLNLSKLQIISPIKDETQAFIMRPDILADKIDYAPLKKVNYNISSTAQQLVYHNKTYTSVIFESSLNDGLLKVSKFNTQHNENKIDLTFTLNSNNVPEIEGNYDIQSLLLPKLGGTIYEIQNGVLNSAGHFKSIIPSAKEFFENLSAKGNYNVANTAIKGWDLDLIKFELEQRKTTEGLESSVLNDLKNGLSPLTKVSGDFTVSNGVLITDNTLLESPVANSSMKLDLNLSNWLFTANFETIYRNASFSDVLKYTFGGNLVDPIVKVDLSESLKRIGETESMVEEAKEQQEKAQQQKLQDKIDSLKHQIEAELKNVSQMDRYISKYKPQTDKSDILDAYDLCLENVAEIKQMLSEMNDTLSNNPDEKVLMEIGTQLNSVKSRLSFIPKSLEDNFVLDSKYIFEDLFDKIAWVYNVATNNATYYTSLSDAYLAQIKLLQNTENPISEDIVSELKEDKEIITIDIEKIRTLHNKMRENYVAIVETTKASDMKEKNELTIQALQTLIAYTERMNKKILNNLRKFREVLELTADDDEQYIIYPPHDIDDIDTKQPTTAIPLINNKSGNSEAPKNLSDGTSEITLDKKKEQTASLILPEFENGLSASIQKFKISHAIPVKNIATVDASVKTDSGLAEQNIAVSTDISLNPEEKIADTGMQILAEPSISVLNEQPQDSILLKQANETVHSILAASSRVLSSSETATKTHLPIYKTFALNITDFSSDNNDNIDKNINMRDLSLKSGFKKNFKEPSSVLSFNQQMTVLNLLSSEKAAITPRFDNSNHLSTSSFVTTEKVADTVPSNSLIVNNKIRQSVSFSGNVGKSMLRNHTSVTQRSLSLPKQYLFVSNDVSVPFSGHIIKNMSLNVK